MKKLLLCLLLISMALPAGAIKLGVGLSGGVNMPVLQEDQGSGTVFGLKGKLNILPGVSVEPNINFAAFGESKQEEFGNRPGSKITSFGVDAILGSGLPGVGVKMYGILGGGIYKTTREFDDSATKIGWATGLGLEVGITKKIGIDVRGKLNVISSEGGATRKSAALTGGVNYYIGF